MLAEVVKVEQWHVDHVATHARKADRKELMAAGNMTPLEAIIAGLAIGGIAWAGVINGVPCCIFGVCPVGGMFTNMGRPWMVGTDLIDRCAVAFLRRNKRFILAMLDQYSYLVNYVDVRNVKAIQWLDWLGFKFSQPAPYGVHSLPFMRFEMGE